jgi:hypothetical protein
MVYKTQNYWILELCPSSGILKTRKQSVPDTECFRPRVSGETPILLGPLERANVSH